MKRYDIALRHNPWLNESPDGEFARYEDIAHMRHEMLNIAADLAALMHDDGMPMTATAKLQKLSLGLRSLALPEDRK